jgi:hypothetical protein
MVFNSDETEGGTTRTENKLLELGNSSFEKDSFYL